jgi:hypothetical protein
MYALSALRSVWRNAKFQEIDGLYDEAVSAIKKLDGCCMYTNLEFEDNDPLVVVADEDFIQDMRLRASEVEEKLDEVLDRLWDLRGRTWSIGPRTTRAAYP